MRDSPQDTQLQITQVAASVAGSDGGPATVVVELNRALWERGVCSNIFTTDADGHRRLGVVERKSAETNYGKRLRIYRRHRPHALKTSFPLAMALVPQIRKSDLVHIHGLYLFHTIAAALIARVWRVPYVLQPHGVLEQYQQQRSRRRKRFYDKLIGDYIRRHAAGFIVADESEIVNGAPLIEPERAFIVPLGARLVSDRDAPFGDWWSDGWANDRIVLFLGRITAKKRIDLAIAAMPEILRDTANARLVIAGDDQNVLGRQLRLLAKESSAEGRINFIGPVYLGEKTRLLKQASCFVLPSENENFAVSVAEALQAGLPCVVSQNVAMSRVIQETMSGLVLRSLETTEIAQCVSRVLTKDLNPELSAKALQAGASLTWDACAERAETVYRQVLAVRPKTKR